MKKISNKLIFGAALVGSLAVASTTNAATVLWEGQSPIDIPASSLKLTKNYQKIGVHYQTETINLVNTFNPSDTIAREWAALKGQPASGPAFNSYVRVNGAKYVLAQFHFHTPSEHKLDANGAPAEIHFVHLRVHDNGAPYCVGEPQSLLVIGAFINAGPKATKGEIAKIFAHGELPADNTGSTVEITDFDLGKLLPAVANSYRYSGSLTAPSKVDCTKDVTGVTTEIYNDGNTIYNSSKSDQLDAEIFPEAVSWVVLKKPIIISEEDLQKLEAAMGENSRPVQPVLRRSIKLVN